MARRFKRNAAHAARQGEQQTAAAAADLERVQQRQRNRAAKPMSPVESVSGRVSADVWMAETLDESGVSGAANAHADLRAREDDAP
jgi:hypothetical protein